MIRLLRVVVDNFRAIEQAEVELGPGLNILHGPNDLGKSTLAAAIRAALLLPMNSAEADNYAPWTGGDAPQVTLTFQSGPDAFHRVVKRFSRGSGASAVLARSRDGVTFTTEVSGRAVDEKLRALLGWGIPAPGGSTRIKGVPQAFLAQVLLAGQTDVDAILAESLADDGEESGRLRLTTALQAFAVDPRFKRALEEAQTEVDKHFAAKSGKRTTKQDAPHVQAAKVVQGLQHELDELEQQAKSAVMAREKVRSLAAAEQAAEAELTLREEALAAAELGRSQQRAIDAASAVLERAVSALQAAEAQTRAAAEKAAEVKRLEAEVTTCDAAAVRAAEALAQAAKAREEARQSEVREAGAGAAAQRALRRSELEKKRAALDHAQDGERARLAAITSALEAAGALDTRRRTAQAALEQAESTAERSGSARRQCEQLLAQHSDLRAFLRWSEAVAARKSLDAARASAAQLASDTEVLRSSLVVPTETLGLPTLAEAHDIASLSRNLELAEARLGGGLSLTVRKPGESAVEVRADGAVADHGGHVAAERRLEIRVGTTELEVLAGGAEARRKVAELTERWSSTAVPVLERCGVASAADLLAACEAQAAARERARSVTAELEAHAARQALLSKDIESLTEAASGEAELDAELAGKDRARLAQLAKQAAPRWQAEAEKAERELRTRLAQSTEAEQSARQAVALCSARVEGIHDEQTRAELQARALGEDLPALRTQLTLRVATLETDAQALDDELHALVASEGALLADARARVASSSEVHRNAVARTQTAEAALTTARSLRDGAAGEARALAQAVARLPLEALRSDHSAAELALARLPRPSPSTTDEDVSAARSRVDSARQRCDQARREHYEARGALTEAGGATVEERRGELDEAYKAAVERQRVIEQDADAWKLLRDMLQASESAGVQHVGKVLSDRVGPRFAQLTRRRYSGVELGPNLKTEGVRTHGGSRSPEVLSVGTREQLATLLRLAIAETLESAVVFDDHLVQSDAERLDWFVAALAEAAKRVQVVVVTCRPRDYEAAKRIEGVSVGWVNLGERIRRSAGQATAPALPAASAALVGGTDARSLPELLRAALAELAMTPAEAATALSAGTRIVELWLEGKQAPAGPFRARLAALLGEGAAPGSARAGAVERLRS